ncbi:ABC transporter permease [Frigidibacter sp. MR17.14]|uniref:ABC transporter permease n=1 Tax=Frigidibacter sp. MR17.14 TaxID=3126509 RepID=UPI003012EBB2
MAVFTMGPLAKRRWRNFRANGRAFWSLWIFLALFGASLFAEFIANDKPFMISYKGQWYFPIYRFYPETAFGGDFQTEAVYSDPAVQCLIKTGGREECWDDPVATQNQAFANGQVNGEAVETGWMLWPIIPYSFDTVNNVGSAPSAPDAQHWLGTDDTARDVLARIIYGFRLAVVFTLIVSGVSTVIGIAAGAVQGYFGGWVDLIFQRVLEIWASTPSLYIIIILSAILGRSFWLLVAISIMFGWTALVGVVRAEFLRARNFEYVRAARALGVSDAKIMFRHILPNAMVATLTMLPFLITGTIGSLAALDYLGYGLPSAAPSLGELSLQAKNNLTATWLGFSAFFTYAIMLSLLVFIFEGVRDAFDPRKTFA